VAVVVEEEEAVGDPGSSNSILYQVHYLLRHLELLLWAQIADLLLRPLLQQSLVYLQFRQHCSLLLPLHRLTLTFLVRITLL
jgi:hypothetical protein